jgi:hypothetical protein
MRPGLAIQHDFVWIETAYVSCRLAAAWAKELSQRNVVLAFPTSSDKPKDALATA